VALREVIGEGLVDVQQQQDKVIVTVGAGGAFASGSADLTDDARAIMGRIALSAAGGAEQIVVTGHTDSVPLNGGAFVDNWGLAAARASAVVRELGAQGTLTPARLSAVSRGESAPVADNTTDTGREANRRIEILFDFAAAGDGR
jgi:chemotaxis protein MotB